LCSYIHPFILAFSRAQNLLDMVPKENEYYQTYLKALMLINRQHAKAEALLLKEIRSDRSSSYTSSRRDLVRLYLYTYEYSWAKMAEVLPSLPLLSWFFLWSFSLILVFPFFFFFFFTVLLPQFS